MLRCPLPILIIPAIIILLLSCTISTPSPPNIVWITSEDNSKHYMKLFDPNGVETPHIASLASSGLIFTHAFSNAPVCSAARSTLISGCYGPRIASHYHRGIGKVPMPAGVEMFPSYLRRAGYYTTNNSKEDYNIIKADNVWDESSRQASWSNRHADQPFFHVQNIHTTHESRLHFTPEDMASIMTTTSPDDFQIQPNHPQTDIFRYTNAYYRDKIQEMDRQVHEVVEQLEADGLLESTFIFYFGDHGGVLPGSKGYVYETGLHVPLVIRVPKKYRHLSDAKPGSTVNGFVSFVDFGPTVMNLAGIPVPEGMDGKAFLGSGITSPMVERRNITFSYADRFDEKYDMVRAIRKGKYKYIRNFQPHNFDGLMNNYRYKQLAYQEWQKLYQDGQLNPIQSAFFNSRKPEMLYDLESDPFETNNLAYQPDMGVVISDMRSVLESLMKELPDLSMYPEHVLNKSAFRNPVKFGQMKKPSIGLLLDIANLVYEEFEDAKPKLNELLSSRDPWERYWAINVCTAFGLPATSLKEHLRNISQHDTELINRVKAAEYMALFLNVSPVQSMTRSLYESKDATEALLILNSIVLMMDGWPGYKFNIDSKQIDPIVLENVEVNRRIQYLLTDETKALQ